MKLLSCVVTALACLASLAHADAPGGGLGTKDPGLFNLKGQIYFLPDGTDHMPPDLDKQKVEGVIYTESLDVAPRSFDTGFPGVTNRFEWFGIVYTGKFQTKAAGDYVFRSLSDDGIIVWVDGAQVLAEDSIHGPSEATGTAKLKPGLHDIKVWYFQGPATEIALQLWLTPPGGTEKIFSIKDYAGDLGLALKDLNGEATKDGIRVRLDAKVLFDVDKSIVKSGAKKSLEKLATVLKMYPNATLAIGGHTSSEGGEEHNKKLSQDRADAVKTALTPLVPKTVTITATGYGSSQPVTDNKTEKTRAPNRRVEIFVKP